VKFGTQSVYASVKFEFSDITDKRRIMIREASITLTLTAAMGFSCVTDAAVAAQGIRPARPVAGMAVKPTKPLSTKPASQKPVALSPTASQISGPRYRAYLDPETSNHLRVADWSSELPYSARPEVIKNVERELPLQDTRVYSWSPGSEAPLGSLLHVSGRNLSAVEIYFNGFPLPVEARADWALDVRLPAYPVTARLEFYDPATSEFHALTENFEVVDTTPKAFDFFRTTADTFSPVNTYLLAATSLYSYENEVGAEGYASFVDNFRDKFQGLGMERVDALYVENINLIAGQFVDTEFVVMSNDDVVIVGFRGTEGFTGFFDIITDVQIPMIDLPSDLRPANANLLTMPRVHQGFWNAVNAVYPALLNLIRDHQDNGQKIWITGHSLGGALATLTAYRIERSEPDLTIEGTMTFGAPSLGNQNFKNAYNGQAINSRRWHREGDPVPVFLQWPYRHVGIPAAIFDNGTVEPSSGTTSFLPNLITGLTDHHNRYAADLYTWVSGLDDSQVAEALGSLPAPE